MFHWRINACNFKGQQLTQIKIPPIILLLSILLLLLGIQRYINCLTKSELLIVLMDEMENITYAIQERTEVTGGNYLHDSWH